MNGPADPFIDLEPPAPEPEHDVEVEDDGPASWAPVDLSAILAGTITTPVPTLLERTDGVCLLYPGLTHSIHGESESGKSLVCQYLAASLLSAGERVVYLDFESDAPSVVERMRLFGTADDDIARGLVYIAPETHPNGTAGDRLAWEWLLDQRPTLVVIDGVTEALGLWGASSLDNDELTSWGRAFPRRVATSTGAAVVMVDHVVKSSDGRGRHAIGGQAKLAMITGAAYTLDVDEPLGRGLRGVVRLKVGKDRPGFVRGHAGPMDHGSRLQDAARFVLDATIEDEPPVAELLPPERLDLDDDERIPTVLMRRASDFIASSSVPVSKSTVLKSVEGRSEYVRKALEQLVARGYVAQHAAGGNRVSYTSRRPYRAHD